MGAISFRSKPGHSGEILEDVEMVEFTQEDEYHRKSKHVAENLEGS